jgi:hypothetical protein
VVRVKKLNTGYLSRQTMHDMRRCYDKVKAEPYGLHGFTEEDLQSMAMMLCLYEHRKIRESLAHTNLGEHIFAGG